MTDIAGERARLAAQGLEITYREAWGAIQDYTSDRTVIRPAQWLFLHITVTADPADTPAAEAEACRVVEAIGQERFGIGWSYNAGVMQSGRLYEGQPLTRRGAHTVNDLPNPAFPTGSLNQTARACALVQNVQDAVTNAQIDSAARWGAALRRSGEAIANAEWYGHRDVTAKSCPGDIAYARLGELNALTDYYTQYGLVQTARKRQTMDLCHHPDGSGRVDAAVISKTGEVFHYWGLSAADLVATHNPLQRENLGGNVKSVAITYANKDLVIWGHGQDDSIWSIVYTDATHIWGPWRESPAGDLLPI